jgi:D-beta-D-heptose 7-phosphate kinase/D-beta-D-heptose 1-phosphate adenosyltransferase
MKPLTTRYARSLLARMRNRRVLVLGDVMLDEFIWGHVARISPEAPVPVVQVARESLHVGGAGNVARNVRALGGIPTLVGVVGRDAAAAKIRTELEAFGVPQRLVEADDGRPTTVKTRIIAHQQQIVRADRERSDAISPALEAVLIAAVRETLVGASALVLSDYAKGVVTPGLLRAVLPAARRRGIPVLVDPKVLHFPLYRRVSVVTPNQLETEQASGVVIRREQDLVRAAERLLRLLRCEALLVTRGEHGMSLFRPGRPPAHVPTFAREVYDVTGAGDTVIATLGLALAAGARVEQAAVLANSAAGVVVGKVGTATALPEEVLAAVEETSGSSTSG